MTISVLDFYRKIEDASSKNPFTPVLHDPVFYILSYVNGKVKELTLKLSGEVEYPLVVSKDFEIESYKSYIIITDYLLGEQGDNVRKKWGLSKEDFRELIFEMYFALIKEHSTCNCIKRAFLVLLGIWKFFAGRKIK